ncbi:MAG: RNA polymerase sigma factor [Bacteroidota bacterium]|nr:RNA polymerase sigma factor [Bacteroidota bacterium]
MSIQEETELIRAAKADPACFAPLYERYFNAIYRFLLRRCQHRELAADLTQQTFLKAMVALGSFTDHGVPFRAWLYRIALNEIRMYWRKRKEVVIDIDRSEALLIATDLAIAEPDEQLHRLAQALSRLDARKAQLIELRYMDGASFAEIGAIMEIGEDAAKMRLHRVLQFLRNYLAKKP